MKIHVQVAADREEGKTMSGELVAEALVAQLEGEQIEVEDSIYSITSVEAEAERKAKGGDSAYGIDVDAFLVATGELLEAYWKERPLAIGNDDGPMQSGEPTGPVREPDGIDQAMTPFLFSDRLMPAIRAAQARYAAKQKGAAK